MDPRAEYTRRRDLHRERIESLERRHRRVAVLRALSFLFMVALAFIQLSASAGLMLLFILAATWHYRLECATDRARRLVDWYDRALRRCDGESDPNAPTGNEWLAVDHPYAGELDILGPASVFAAMCHAMTGTGRARLAEWLLNPAAPQQIAARQRAMEELSSRLDDREVMVLAAPRRVSSLQAFRRWQQLPIFDAPWRVRLAAGTLSLALLGALCFWLLGRTPLGLLMPVSFLAYLFARHHQARLGRLLAPLDELADELRSYRAFFDLVERGDFACDTLCALTARVAAGGQLASRRARELARLRDALDLPRNVLFAPIGALLLWRLQVGLALESWRRRHAAQLLEAVEALAEFEALHSLARDAFEHPDHAVPLVDAAFDALHATQLRHPLLSQKNAVANDLQLGNPTRLFVVSGSNMSGKSTWLRSIGVNVVLAQSGARVCAQSWRMPPLLVAASLRASDSLAAGESRFAAELHRLRIVLAEAQRGERLLFLLDELFHGTHSQDRRAGARAFVGRLLDMGHIGLFTTHDLALAELDADWQGAAANVHFRDSIEGERAYFDYQVHDGVVRHSNALRLMRAQGLI